MKTTAYLILRYKRDLIKGLKIWKNFIWGIEGDFFRGIRFLTDNQVDM